MEKETLIYGSAAEKGQPGGRNKDKLRNCERTQPKTLSERGLYFRMPARDIHRNPVKACSKVEKTLETEDKKVSERKNGLTDTARKKNKQTNVITEPKKVWGISKFKLRVRCSSVQSTWLACASKARVHPKHHYGSCMPFSESGKLMMV